VGYVACMSMLRNVHKNLGGKLEWKKQLERPRRAWKGTTETKSKEVDSF
jgi:hypothetical protein